MRLGPALCYIALFRAPVCAVRVTDTVPADGVPWCFTDEVVC